MCETTHQNDETIPFFHVENQFSNQSYTTAPREADVHTPSLKKNSFSLYREAKTLTIIALPTVIVQFSNFFIYPQCASAVGRHMDDQSLAAFSLGSLSGNMTCISIIVGTLSASETLQPRAFGLKRYREVGLLAIRGFVMCLVSLCIPIFLLLTRAEVIFNQLGQDEAVSLLASKWIKVYVLSVPASLLFRLTQRYLACQNIVLPCAFGAAIGCFVVHPIALKWAIGKFGFMGSSWAIVISQSAQFILCLSYIIATGSYEKATLPRLSMKSVADALNFRALFAFAKLSVGGIFALSEWWFWECICFMAGQFGLIEFCVHTVTYQLVPVLFMIPLGISIGLSVRLGVLLPISVHGAKRLAACTMMFTIVTGIVLCSTVYKYQSWIVSMFTTDEAVIQGCEKVWFNLCVFTVLDWIYSVSLGILSALGLQWRTATTMFIVLWCFTIPAMIKLCFSDKKGYYYLWNILPVAYTLLNVGLAISYTTADWDQIGAGIKLDKMKAMKEEQENRLSKRDSEI